MWGLGRIIYDSDGYILTNNHVIEGAMSSASKILPNASIEVICQIRLTHHMRQLL